MNNPCEFNKTAAKEHECPPNNKCEILLIGRDKGLLEINN